MEILIHHLKSIIDGHTQIEDLEMGSREDFVNTPVEDLIKTWVDDKVND
jgi:hypothetical protein